MGVSPIRDWRMDCTWELTLTGVFAVSPFEVLTRSFVCLHKQARVQHDSPCCVRVARLPLLCALGTLGTNAVSTWMGPLMGPWDH